MRDTFPAPRPAAIELEAAEIVRGVEEQIRDEELEEKYEAWIERLELKFWDDPEGLERALAYARGMYAGTMEAKLRTDITRYDDLEAVKDAESAQHEKAAAIDAALTLLAEVGCDGPLEVKIGRFLRKKTVSVCALADTPEFQKVQEYREADARFIQELRNNGEVV